ncbi:Quinol monooxygenase YgiN [Granulicella rosea]|uniref:Quinol monooxygenase YgiN n=1 Tax=Granulicella rosea TaxID=474952 RepID=A0A239LB66_9BACT|nr:putative quinol monooxygenase [Granulicella rosea]SNT27202.1 Quinol monooxygenase YgiN [Granulicella rosea]
MSLFTSDKTSADSGHINVIAEIKAKTGHENAVREMLTALVETSRAEDGCKAYHLLEEKHAPGSFYTYEEWVSEQHLAKHLEGAKGMLVKAETLLHGELKLTMLNHLV